MRNVYGQRLVSETARVGLVEVLVWCGGGALAASAAARRCHDDLAPIARRLGGVARRRRPLEVGHVSYGVFDEPFDFVLPAADADLKSLLGAGSTPLEPLRSSIARLGGREVAYLSDDGVASTGEGTAAKITFTLTGRANERVQVAAIRARILASGPAWSRALLHTAPQGVNTRQSIGFELSGADLNARELTEELPLEHISLARGYLAHGRILTLDRDEEMSFEVCAVAFEHSWRWQIEVETTAGFTLIIDDAGQPFTTSARALRYDEAWTRDFSRQLVYRPCSWPGRDCDPRILDP